MSYRTVILSDLHLGSKASRSKEFSKSGRLACHSGAGQTVLGVMERVRSTSAKSPSIWAAVSYSMNPGKSGQLVQRVAKATGKSPSPTLTQDGTMRVTRSQ